MIDAGSNFKKTECRGARAASGPETQPESAGTADLVCTVALRSPVSADGRCRTRSSAAVRHLAPASKIEFEMKAGLEHRRDTITSTIR